MSTEPIRAPSLSWEDVARTRPIFLNLGGCGDCDPRKGYEGFTSVDLRAPGKGRWVRHDLLQPLPLPSGSVERIHTEEMLQFFSQPEIESILRECYRLLAPGGRLRISTCDYHHPKDIAFLRKGSSPHKDRTFLHYELLKEILERSPFTQYEFLHYWKDGKFVEKPIDYSFGHIRRTPEHDPRNRKNTSYWWMFRNFLFRLSRGFFIKPHERVQLRGQPYFITSLVVDCIK